MSVITIRYARLFNYRGEAQRIHTTASSERIEHIVKQLSYENHKLRQGYVKNVYVYLTKVQTYVLQTRMKQICL